MVGRVCKNVCKDGTRSDRTERSCSCIRDTTDASELRAGPDGADKGSAEPTSWIVLPDRNRKEDTDNDLSQRSTQHGNHIQGALSSLKTAPEWISFFVKNEGADK